MGITIIRKTSEHRAPGVTVIRRHSNLKRMRFDGPLLDRTVQFPEDVSFMRGWLRARGLAVGVRDCQALWVKLSIEHYPFPRDPGDYAWLNVGHMTTLVEQHALDHLVPCNDGDPVR